MGDQEVKVIIKAIGFTLLKGYTARKNYFIIIIKEKMKKKIVSIAVVAAVAVAAAWGFNQSNNEMALSDVALSNVEALAGGEWNGTCWLTQDYFQWCYPWGTGLGCAPCFS